MQTPMRNNRDVVLLKAKIYLLQGNNQTAEKTYQKLWQQFNGDSVVAYDYASFLLHKGEYRQAEKLLSKQGKCGEKVKQYRLLIRFYQQSGDYERALSQAKIATKLPDIDWQSRSTFEAKEKELQRIIDSLEE